MNVGERIRPSVDEMFRGLKSFKGQRDLRRERTMQDTRGQTSEFDQFELKKVIGDREIGVLAYVIFEQMSGWAKEKEKDEEYAKYIALM